MKTSYKYIINYYFYYKYQCTQIWIVWKKFFEKNKTLYQIWNNNLRLTIMLLYHWVKRAHSTHTTKSYSCTINYNKITTFPSRHVWLPVVLTIPWMYRSEIFKKYQKTSNFFVMKLKGVIITVNIYYLIKNSYHKIWTDYNYVLDEE